MKKSKLFNACALLLISFFIVSMFGTESESSEFIKYTFYNYSGHTIKNLYMTSSSTSMLDTERTFWGTDFLGDSVLLNGNSVNVQDYNLYGNVWRKYDIKVVWMNGSSVIWTKFSLSNTAGRLELYEDNGNFYLREN